MIDNEFPPPYTLEDSGNYADGKAKMEIAVSMFSADGLLVSRSQARSMMDVCIGCDLVVLNMTGVEEVFPSFCDEIFRVWQDSHPDTRIVIQNATPEIWDRIRAVTLGAS